MAILNKKIFQKFIREEVKKLFEEPGAPISVGLPTSTDPNFADGKNHHVSDSLEYTLEYFDTKMGARQLGSWRTEDMAKNNALDFYKSQKKQKHLGAETDYIGVNSDLGNNFWIFYVNQSYLDGMNKNIFKNKRAYKNWMKVAYDVMRTGEPQGGQYDLKEVDYTSNKMTQPSRLDYPSGLANSSGVTNTQDIVKAKNDFTDRNFPPKIKLTKKDQYYVFSGETFNLRDIFDLMKHHTLIPFQLKVVNDQEFWITKSKESAQKAVEMIKARYPKSNMFGRKI